MPPTGEKLMLSVLRWGFPGGTSGKEPACQCRRRKRRGLIPGLGSSPGGGNGNPLQYSCLENPMDRGAWGAIVHRVEKSWTRLGGWAHIANISVKCCPPPHRLSHTHTFFFQKQSPVYVFLCITGFGFFFNKKGSYYSRYFVTCIFFPPWKDKT